MKLIKNTTDSIFIHLNRNKALSEFYTMRDVIDNSLIIIMAFDYPINLNAKQMIREEMRDFKTMPQ